MQVISSQNKEPSLTYKHITVGLVCVTTPFLLATHEFKWLAWLALLGVTISLIVRINTRFARHILLLIGSLILLSLIPINTGISFTHMLIMGSVLALTLILPYVITTYGFKERVITFPFRCGRSWHKREVAYILFAGLSAYLLLPFYLSETKSYLNWTVALDTSHIVRLFIGTNALGIWDELFFVGVCLTLLCKHIKFIWADLAQATLWTAFLYTLGFRGWGPYVIFIFALTQGYIFQKSKSLLYLITIHLTIDFVLFLTLVHLQHPEYLRIFIT